MVRRQRRTGALDDRARLVLAAVVEEHIRTATPVGSMAISDGYKKVAGYDKAAVAAGR